MKYLQLQDAKSDILNMSKIILGGAPLGTAIDKELSFEIMDYFALLGGNTIDTARVYCDWIPDGKSVSEKTIGEWAKLRGNRKDINIITKGGHPSLDNMNESRLKEIDIRYDMEESLNALQMDYVDLYFLHRDDINIPVGDIMDVLHNLVKDGKTKAIGASNWSVERIMEANKYAKQNNKTPFIVSQIQWSLAECFPETFKDNTIVCMNEKQYNQYIELGMPVIAFSSQAGGVFSCGYKSDLADIEEKHKKYVSSENCKRYNNLINLCNEKGCSGAHASLSYIMQNKLSASAIIGCSSLNQLKDSMLAVHLNLTEEEINRLTEYV